MHVCNGLVISSNYSFSSDVHALGPYSLSDPYSVMMPEVFRKGYDTAVPFRRGNVEISCSLHSLDVGFCVNHLLLQKEAPPEGRERHYCENFITGHDILGAAVLIASWCLMFSLAFVA